MLEVMLSFLYHFPIITITEKCLERELKKANQGANIHE